MAVPYKSKCKIGEKIKKQRLKDEKSLRALAADCEMSYATLNDIENGNGFPTERVFLSLIENLSFTDENKKKMYDLYAEVKKTAPPDVMDFLSKNKEAVELVRRLIKETKGAEV